MIPGLRRPDYDYWADMAELLRQPGARPGRLAARQQPRKLEIARTKDPAAPAVSEQLAIEALATGRPPAGAMTRERFAALTPKGQVATVLGYCVAGERSGARSLMAWIPQERRGEAPYRDFLAWASRGC